MNKKLIEVRRSIVERNKKRGLRSIQPQDEKVTIPIFPEEEEKHGYFPYVINPSTNNERSGMFFYNIMIKGIVAVILFFGVALIHQSDVAMFSKPKDWTSNVMTEEFPFARVSSWYQQTFGTPLAYSPKNSSVKDEENLHALPVSGNVTETFQTNGSGIFISPRGATPVSAWNEGVVIFAGNNRDTNKTVIIQHPDLSKTTYALLSSIDVHLYQAVSSNQRIGTFNPTEENDLVYFSMEKNNEYIDPIQVIQVDDLP